MVDTEDDLTFSSRGGSLPYLLACRNPESNGVGASGQGFQDENFCRADIAGVKIIPMARRFRERRRRPLSIPGADCRST